MNPVLDQALEIAGAVLILTAFALAQFRGIDRHGLPYLVLNVAGGAILAFMAWRHWQPGFLLLQGVWTVVALWGLVRWSQRGRPA